MSTLFKSLVSQEDAISALERALAASKAQTLGQEMTQSWLFTGPPGSGRSNMAKAFAASLLCENAGCGNCETCISALEGVHQDIELIDTKGLSIKIDEIREVVSRSAWGASTSKWRVIVIEDCDRMTEGAGNALLKALEEPGSSTVWLLCAPTLHDVLPTVRSRCRHIQLKTPTKKGITEFLISSLGANSREAEFAANLSQGHIGKARWHLTDERFKSTRKNIFTIFLSVNSESRALKAAQELIRSAEENAEARLSNLPKPKDNPALGARAQKELEKEEKARTTRAIRDELDGYLLDFTTFLRDCLTKESSWINEDLAEEITKFQLKFNQESTMELLSTINESRRLLTTNASQVLVLESLFLRLVQHKVGK